MIRRYVDKAGQPRRLKYLKGGDYVHWHRDFSACWSTWWVDLDDNSQIRIPNNAWKCLGIEFQDEE